MHSQQQLPALLDPRVPPDANRFWWGFRATRYASDRRGFYDSIGSIFAPFTAHMMGTMGLTSYMLALPPMDKPDTIPDEVALVFYQTQETYLEASRKTVGGRAYARLHSAVFNFDRTGPIPPSGSQFPTLLGNQARPNQPYHLFDGQIDWMQGVTDVYMAARQPQTPVETFQQAGQHTLANLQEAPPPPVDAAQGMVADDWLLFWIHNDRTEPKRLDLLATLADVATPLLDTTARNVTVDRLLNEEWDGIATQPGECLNLVFPRHDWHL